MVVAHPDDESLWAGRFLEDNSDTTVICLTHGGTQERETLFRKAMAHYGVSSYLIWDYPDRGQKGFSASDTRKITHRLASVLEKNAFESVITHSRYGEYGHRCHRDTHEIVTRTVGKTIPIDVFDFNFGANRALGQSQRKALKAYFVGAKPSPKMAIRNSFFKGSSKPNSTVRRKLGRLWEKPVVLLLSVWLGFRSPGFSHLATNPQDQALLDLAQFASLSRLTEVQNKIPGPVRIIQTFPELFRKYSDRRYIWLNFLPQLEGVTLGVGCHEFNRLDHIALRNPKLYWTIDFDEHNSRYGSPHGHWTADFLTWTPPKQITNLLLFGVLGTPNNHSSYFDQYLFGRDEELINRADQMLPIGGRLLIGAELVKTKSEIVRKIDAAAWARLYRHNKILRGHYRLLHSIVSADNVTLDLVKIR